MQLCCKALPRMQSYYLTGCRVIYHQLISKGLLIIYASGWGRREVGWVNDFLGGLKVGYIIFFASQRFNGILLIALYWSGSYYFIVHKVG